VSRRPADSELGKVARALASLSEELAVSLAGLSGFRVGDQVARAEDWTYAELAARGECAPQLHEDFSQRMLTKVCILQVEDDSNDIFFLEHAFRNTGLAQALRVARDGQIAVDYLGGTGDFADRAQHPLPCLVLLDLKLPRKDGFEVLQWIRGQPALKPLTVIVLTSSARQEDIDRCYSLGANSFVVKPSELGERLEFAKLIQAYWLRFHRGPSLRARESMQELAVRSASQ
jgi:CheY-like chemotaxis protein